MIPYREFKKQREVADKLVAKFNTGQLTEAEMFKWLNLDIQVRKLATEDSNVG